MFTALHPLLLWGATAVAVPILIHLLLRQRPRPRPWAAMRWLLAAAQAAQRRYRLTNLLLLLLRCLIVLLLALAIARPSIAGIGGGERLLLVIDRTASMGARGNDPGPLAIAKAALSKVDLSYRTVVLATVADKVEEVSSGSLGEALAAVAKIEASELPGGLDRAAAAPFADQITALVGNGADVVLVSDFQQDDGALLAALLAPRSRTLARWRVGATSGNALVTGVEQLDDLRPGEPGDLVVRVAGNPHGAGIAADDGPFLPASSTPSGGLMRISVPPLTPGEHRVRVRLDDDGLAYDNLLELPVTVRPAVATLMVEEHGDFLAAALQADVRSLTYQSRRPAQFGDEPLPPHGLVALRAPIADSARLRAWIANGGVLWAGLGLLRDDSNLRELVKDVTSKPGIRAGGPYACGEKDIDEVMSHASRAAAPVVQLPGSAEVLLRVGDAPLVVALPAGRGWVIVELAELATAGDESFKSRGTTPLWVSRMVRRYTARLGAPRFWQAGVPAPETLALKHGGTSATARTGESLLLAPGAWQAEDGSTVVVLPNLNEGQLAKSAPAGAVASFEAALPQRPGLDWGLPLAIAALLAALGEGMFAAWAGRAYGR